MTANWEWVSAAAACVLLLVALLFRSSRFAGTGDHASRTPPTRWFGLVSAVAPVVAAFIIGIYGVIVAQRFIDSREERARRDRQYMEVLDRTRQQTELRRLRLETVEKFFPQFLKNDQDKGAAILAISAAGDLDLAADLAGLFPSSASVAALETIARRSAPDERQPLVIALGAMDTDQANAALTRLFGDVARALVPFACDVPGDPQTKQIVAGVMWNGRWLFVPLGDLTNAKPLSALALEEHGRQPYGDRLDRILLVKRPPAPPSLMSVQFASTMPQRGQPVFAVGLDSTGRDTMPHMGFVADVQSDAVVVRFARDFEQAAGSLLVLPSGAAVGMLSHEQPEAASRRYIRADDILGWFQQLEREEAEKGRQGER